MECTIHHCRSAEAIEHPATICGFVIIEPAIVQHRIVTQTGRTVDVPQRSSTFRRIAPEYTVCQRICAAIATHPAAIDTSRVCPEVAASHRRGRGLDGQPSPAPACRVLRERAVNKRRVPAPAVQSSAGPACAAPIKININKIRLSIRGHPTPAAAGIIPINIAPVHRWTAAEVVNTAAMAVGKSAVCLPAGNIKAVKYGRVIGAAAGYNVKAVLGPRRFGPHFTRIVNTHVIPVNVTTENSVISPGMPRIRVRRTKSGVAAFDGDTIFQQKSVRAANRCQAIAI